MDREITYDSLMAYIRDFFIPSLNEAITNETVPELRTAYTTQKLKIREHLTKFESIPRSVRNEPGCIILYQAFYNRLNKILETIIEEHQDHDDHDHDDLGSLQSELLKASSVDTDRFKSEIEGFKSLYSEMIRRAKSISPSSSDYWNSECRMQVFGSAIPESIEEMMHPSLRGEDPSEYSCRIARYPFALGAVRAVYKGRFRNPSGSWKDVVFKEFINPSDQKEKEYFSMSENSAIASSLVERYQTENHLPFRCRMLPSRVVRVNQDGRSVYYNMEDFIEGEFKKWTNNAGGIPERNEHLMRFSKWTHSVTSGYLMVTDIQGFQVSHNEIVLTDPAILCRDLSRFGPTNFTAGQMTLCLEALEKGRSSTVFESVTARTGFSLKRLSSSR